jgi:hypothetical protein
MTNQITRSSFADFLDRLSEGQISQKDWFEHIVNHYHDEILENIRVDCVRLRQSVDGSFPFTSEQQGQLRKWSKELRGEKNE